MDRVFTYSLPMAGKQQRVEELEAGSPVARTLAANVRALMASTKELDSNPKLGKRTGLGSSAIHRILNGHNATIETVEKIAAAFDLLAWQLLVPGFEPKKPPALKALSPSEKEFYERIEQAELALKALKNG